MKRYNYNDPIFNHKGDIIGNRVLTISDKEILDRYWSYWYNSMIRKYGYDHPLITEANCIEDWVISNWAWMEKCDVEKSIDSGSDGIGV